MNCFSYLVSLLFAILLSLLLVAFLLVVYIISLQQVHV